MYKKRKVDEKLTIEEEEANKASAHRTLKIDRWWVENYQKYGNFTPCAHYYGQEMIEEVFHPTYKPEELKFSGYSPAYEWSFGGLLLPWHEVKAKNGILLYPEELKKEENRNLQTYYYSGRAEPTRGNCPICGASGPLGEMCQNRCKDPWESRESMQILTEYKTWYNLHPSQDPLGISKWACGSFYSHYWAIMTPDKRAIIDPELWAEIFYDMPPYKTIIMEYLGEDAPTRRGKVKSRQPKRHDENWSFDGMREYNSGTIIVDKYVLTEEDTKWQHFVWFCEENMKWGHPYNLKKDAKYKAHWNENPSAWHKVR